MILKHVGAVSLGKMLGSIYAVLGLIFGAFFSLFSIFGVMMGMGEDMGPFFGIVFGLGAIVFLPILYGVMGFIGGIVVALIYNVVASSVGGLELEFEEQRQTATAVVPPGP